jgi:hypoxanthine phosphoribosyltransferase
VGEAGRNRKRMKVITLDDDGFEKACSDLASHLHDKGRFDIIIGVRTGGAVVAAKVFEKLSQSDVCIKYFEAGAERSTTATKKKGGIKAMIRSLPRLLQDFLRNMEHIIVVLTSALHFEKQRSIRLDDELRTYLATAGEGHVCVIDDAIDSGATIRALVEEIRGIAPEIVITIAVLVVTLRAPVVRPDVSVFENVLIRFPWAVDAKRAGR